MSVFLRIDINIVAIVMLLLVYFLAHGRLEKQDSLNKLFFRTSILIIHQLFIETMTCIINKRPELWLIPISIMLHILLFSLAPILTSYCYFLIRKIIFPNEEVKKRRYFIFLLPVVINFILVILSPIYHFVFYIDDMNVYHRGTLYILSAVFAYGYIVYGLLTIIINKRKISQQDFTLLLVFNGFSISGGIVQTLIYGPLLLWSCSAFSLVIAFLFIQERMVHKDVLTGAWDRGSFDHYIAQKIQFNYKKFGLIYVDMDHLKEINDTYGHVEGDYAIKMAVALIRGEIRKDDIIVRLGGDEFLVILDCDTIESINNTIERIEMSYHHFNRNSSKSYRLECSFGADIFDPRSNNIDQFINHIDTLMYRNKNNKKAIN